jgi:preprotein translocase subunit SecD
MSRRSGIIALAIVAVVGCKKERVLRVTYEVDFTAAYDGEKDAQKVLRRARDVLANRLSSRVATVSVDGNDLSVELSALSPEELELTKATIQRPGRVALKMLDDAGSATVFGPTAKLAEEVEEAISPHDELAPDGRDPGGRPRHSKSYYARVDCRPPAHADESDRDCRKRLEAWTARLAVPAEHAIGFEAVTKPIEGADPPAGKTVGWRTMYLFSRAELTQDDITSAVANKEGDVSVTLSVTGALRFEQLTGANVERRLAIIVDDVVSSAPVIKEKIAGGKLSITLPVVDRKTEAEGLARVLGKGALPAPLYPSREEVLKPR